MGEIVGRGCAFWSLWITVISHGGIRLLVIEGDMIIGQSYGARRHHWTILVWTAKYLTKKFGISKFWDKKNRTCYDRGYFKVPWWVGRYRDFFSIYIVRCYTSLVG